MDLRIDEKLTIEHSTDLCTAVSGNVLRPINFMPTSIHQWNGTLIDGCGVRRRKCVKSLMVTNLGADSEVMGTSLLCISIFSHQLFLGRFFGDYSRIDVMMQK